MLVFYSANLVHTKHTNTQINIRKHQNPKILGWPIKSGYSCKLISNGVQQINSETVLESSEEFDDRGLTCGKINSNTEGFVDIEFCDLQNTYFPWKNKTTKTKTKQDIYKEVCWHECVE